MKFYQDWIGRNCSEEKGKEFPVSVPGNIQQDFAAARGFADVQYADNYKQYLPFEDDHWEYETVLSYTKAEGERVFFVSLGIDYKYDILLNGENVYSYEGMFRAAELDITEKLSGGNDILTVHIYPHPKRKDAPVGTRDEADQSCKPCVCYGWDWNPRLLISGMWQEAYIETRNVYSIENSRVKAELNCDMTEGKVTFSFDCAEPCVLSLYDEDGNTVYSGTDKEAVISSPELWWCNGYGKPYLYKWEIKNKGESKEGYIGFRSVKLVRNKGAKDPSMFPKGRYAPPITIKLNGKRIFAKGSNWVNPDLFWGQVDEERYNELLTLARDGHMNILRVWGGASVCKEAFYRLCDKYGILVWQEFMLACNNYPDSSEYLAVLESEAEYIIKTVSTHPCLALWCGGNELFNGWSGMTDQSLPLRLLGKLCYEYDRNTPFIPTSPIMGMAHGGYKFYDEKQGGEVFNQFRRAYDTAYTEFGVPSITSVENLKKIIPEKELFPIKETEAWIAHHGFYAWGKNTWLCRDVLERYFGEPQSIEEMVENSNKLQCAGYQAAFEEMRRQKPHCSMMINWCYNEPWITAANNSIIEYPAKPKPAYEYVKSAMRPALFSAGIAKYSWKEGEMFEAELWLLNDSLDAVSGKVRVSLKMGDSITELLEWNASTEASENLAGPTVRTLLPHAETDTLCLILEAENGLSNSYLLQYIPKTAAVKKAAVSRPLNM